VLFGMT